MLAGVLNVPETSEDWSRWSFNNQDAVNQIRAAIQTQYSLSLPDYQIEPLDFDDIAGWLENNQAAHTAFTGVLGLQSSDLQHTDLADPNQRQAWIYLNYQELSQACQMLKIGP